MATRLITPPSAEPVALDEAKAHLRIEIPDDDALIAALIQATREYVERSTGRQLVDATWEQRLDVFPTTLRLRHPPLDRVYWVRYLDPDGVLQTVPNTDYRVDKDTEPGRIVLAPGARWPVVQAVPNAVRVRYRAGYGDPDAVPAALRATIKLIVGHLYENREAVVTGRTVAKLPYSVGSMLWCYRVPEVA